MIEELNIRRRREQQTVAGLHHQVAGLRKLIDEGKATPTLAGALHETEERLAAARDALTATVEAIETFEAERAARAAAREAEHRHQVEEADAALLQAQQDADRAVARRAAAADEVDLSVYRASFEAAEAALEALDAARAARIVLGEVA